MEWVVCTPGGQRVITPGRLKNTDPFDPDPYNAITWAPSVARHIQVTYSSSYLKIKET